MSKKIFKGLALCLAVVCTAVFSLVVYFDTQYPDRVYTSKYDRLNVGYCTVGMGQQLITASADSSGTYPSVLKMLGIIPVKDVSVTVVPAHSVVVCGTPFGVMLYSEGVMVVGSNSFSTGSGLKNPADDAGIKTGDIILSINGVDMNSIEDIAKQVNLCDGKPIEVVYKRDDERLTASVTPAKSLEDDKYHIGLWVRDSSAGIGTVTFYDPEYSVAVGFGHPICDADTGEIVEISSGTAVKASLYSVRKGAVGNPGELLGTLKIRSTLGDVLQNDDTGVCFECNTQPDGVLMPVAYSSEVKTGKAQIYTTVDGDGAQYYDVQIERIDPSSATKNYVVKITDKELINKTGGIVQGMSGSPIIQNGKLIGAVTHVLVDDPTKGYGIFAENMLETAQSVADENLKEAS